MANWFPTPSSKEYSKAKVVEPPLDLGKSLVLMTKKVTKSPQAPTGLMAANTTLESVSKFVLDVVLKTGYVVDIKTSGLIIGNGAKDNPIRVDVKKIEDSYNPVGGGDITCLLDSNYLVGSRAGALLNIFDLTLPLSSSSGVVKLLRKLLLYADGKNYVMEPHTLTTSPGDKYCYLDLTKLTGATFLTTPTPIRENKSMIFVGDIIPYTAGMTGENTRLAGLKTFISWAGKVVTPGNEKRPRPRGSSILAINKKWADS